MPFIPTPTLPPVYAYPAYATLANNNVQPGTQQFRLTPSQAQISVAAPKQPYLRFQDLKSVEPADVLVVLAHPDDEMFLSGTAETLVRQGKSVQFVYVTNGKAGEDVSGRGMSGDVLGEERSQELAVALKHVGITRPPLMLDFMDGETERYPEAIKETLRAVLLQVQPKTVLLWNAENGMTNHPDHKAVSRYTDEILDTLAVGKTPRDQQDALKIQPLLQNSAVYQATMSKTGYDQFRKFFPESNPSWKPLQYKPDASIAWRVNITPDIALDKRSAHAAHRSQYRADDIRNMAGYFQQYPYEEFVKYQIQSGKREPQVVQSTLK